MIRMIKTSLTALALLLTVAVSQSQAEFTDYQFSGVLPTVFGPNDFLLADDMEGHIGGGDSWTLFLTVNSDTPEGDFTPDPTNAGYEYAVTSAELVFSGVDSEGNPRGYSTNLNFDPDLDYTYIEVSNNDPVFSDQVYTSLFTDSDILMLDVTNEVNPDAISGDSVLLPTSPMEFNQEMLTPNFVFTYKSAVPGSFFISYESTTGSVFRVVPEPSTITLWCLAALGFGGVWWRKRRAS